MEGEARKKPTWVPIMTLDLTANPGWSLSQINEGEQSADHWTVNAALRPIHKNFRAMMNSRTVSACDGWCCDGMQLLWECYWLQCGSINIPVDGSVNTEVPSASAAAFACTWACCGGGRHVSWFLQSLRESRWGGKEWEGVRLLVQSSVFQDEGWPASCSSLLYPTAPFPLWWDQFLNWPLPCFSFDGSSSSDSLTGHS